MGILLSIAAITLIVLYTGNKYLAVEESQYKIQPWLPFPKEPHKIYNGEPIEVLDENGNIKIVFWRVETANVGRDEEISICGWVENKKSKDFINAKFWRQIT